MRRCAVAALLVAAFLTSAGCEYVLAPALPTGAVMLEPRPEYQRWWAEVEACSGHRGDFRRVIWLWTPDSPYFRYENDWYDGYWFEFKHEIVLGAAYVGDSSVVTHEMLHDLLNRGDHPAKYFDQACGAIVAH